MTNQSAVLQNIENITTSLLEALQQPTSALHSVLFESFVEGTGNITVIGSITPTTGTLSQVYDILVGNMPATLTGYYFPLCCTTATLSQSNYTNNTTPNTTKVFAYNVSSGINTTFLFNVKNSPLDSTFITSQRIGNLELTLPVNGSN